ncbi:MAG: DNA repair protein [Gammaproteobacteria bacterium]|nr:DNA repair protein [Gammaproteobacteria bacterium]
MFTAFNNYFPHIGFILIALILGMRHGLDYDHLAIIDSITRRLPQENNLSRFVGILFSFGHGMIVILFCISINVFLKACVLPIWLDRIMFGISIAFLIIFGFMNIYTLFNKNKNTKKIVFSAKRIFQKLKILNLENPISIVIVGAVFAISFDTYSQISLFSLNVNHFVSILFPVFLGIVFMIGMMITDGVNGYVISFFIRRSEKHPFSLSRVLTFCIGFFSATVGIIEVVSLIQGGM